MKYGVYINQAGVADAGFADGRTDLVDWAIIEYIRDWQLSPKATKLGDLVWINYKHLISQMPLLGLNNKQAVSKRVVKLSGLGLIHTDHDGHGRVFCKLSELCLSIISFRESGQPELTGVNSGERGVNHSGRGPVNHGGHSIDYHISIDNQDSIPAGAEKDCAKNAHTDPPIAGQPNGAELKSTPRGQNQGAAGASDTSASVGAGRTPKPASGANTQEFETFWQAYPRRIAKGAAIRAFFSATKIATFSEIMDGVRRYAQTRPDPKYTPHPATWLNQQRWADEIKEEANGKAISRSNAAPTKTDRLNAVIADAIANPPDLSIWGRPRAAYQHDRPMLPGPEPVRERAGADGGGDQDISPGAGGLPH